MVNRCWPHCWLKIVDIRVLLIHLRTWSSSGWVIMTNIFLRSKSMDQELSNAPSTMFLRHLVMFLHFETYALANPQKAWEPPKSGCELDFLPHILRILKKFNVWIFLKFHNVSILNKVKYSQNEKSESLELHKLHYLYTINISFFSTFFQRYWRQTVFKLSADKLYRRASNKNPAIEKKPSTTLSAGIIGANWLYILANGRNIKSSGTLVCTTCSHHWVESYFQATSSFFEKERTIHRRTFQNWLPSIVQ